MSLLTTVLADPFLAMDFPSTVLTCEPTSGQQVCMRQRPCYDLQALQQSALGILGFAAMCTVVTCLCVASVALTRLPWPPTPLGRHQRVAHGRDGVSGPLPHRVRRAGR
jgi:hypothetical protein